MLDSCAIMQALQRSYSGSHRPSLSHPTSSFLVSDVGLQGWVCGWQGMGGRAQCVVDIRAAGLEVPPGLQRSSTTSPDKVMHRQSTPSTPPHPTAELTRGPQS